MNIYTHHFVVTCPNNDGRIHYRLKLRSAQTIMVEEIVEACRFDKAFHEDIADRLYARFGGRQIIKAFHHGVAIKTVRGEV